MQILKALPLRVSDVNKSLQQTKGESFVKRVRVKSIPELTALLGGAHSIEALHTKYRDAGYELIREMKEGKFTRDCRNLLKACPFGGYWLPWPLPASLPVLPWLDSESLPCQC